MENIKLEDFLKVDSIVKTSFPKSTDCIVNTVTGIFLAENEIEFFIIGSEAEFCFATGEQNKVIYSVVDAGFKNKLVKLITDFGKNNGGAVIGEN